MDMIDNIWSGIKKWLKWTFLLYSIMLAYGLTVSLALLAKAGISGENFRDLLISTSLLGGHGSYTFKMALYTSIPVACFIFSCWEALFNNQKRVWRIVIPWVIYGIIEILAIADGLDWNFRIMTVDPYMIYVLITPIICGTVQLIFMLLRKYQRKAESENLV